MPIRITGMNSGLDTDSIIQALMSAYRVKGDKYKKEQTKISWKQDKWKALNTKVLNLYKSLDSLRFSNGYNLKKVTVSDTSKATVSGSSSAMNGTQSLKIKQLAKAAYLTGDKIEADSGKTKLSELTKEDGSPYQIGAGTIRISGNGKAYDIDVDGDMTVNDFINEVNKSGTGVTASYDSTNKRIFISSQKTGKDAGFELSALDADGREALTALGLNANVAVSKEEKEAWEKYNGSDSDIWSKLEEAINGDNGIIAKKKQLAENQFLRDEALLDQKLYQDSVAYLEARSALEETRKNLDANATHEDASAMAQLMKMSGSSLTKEYVMDDKGKLREKKDDDTDKVTYKLEVKKYKLNADGSKGDEVTDDNPVKDGEKTGVEYTFTKSGSTDFTDFSKTYFSRDEYEEGTASADEEAVNSLKNYSTNTSTVKKFENDANANVESGDYGKFNVTQIEDDELAGALTDYKARLARSEEELKDYNQNIKTLNNDLASPEFAVLGVDAIDVDADPGQINDYIQKLAYRVKEFNAGSWTEVKDKDGNTVSYIKEGTNSGAKMVEGADAEIELNGASYTSTTNSFSINGLNIQAQATTNDEEIIVTTTTDTQGIYDKIKDFISEYNSVIAEISSMYNAESAKGYEPLTSDEKEAMSEKEIEEWEKKVKDSLLRRDDSLGSLMNSMTSAMLTSVKIGDKSFSLASLGIKTAGYFHTTAETRNQLHIDGDEDDDTTSANTNTLMNMLNSDPDKVVDIIKGVTENLYKTLNKQMTTTNRLKSINTIYNDKEMKQSYSDYTKTIRAWEEKIQSIEDSYYKKFSAMEVALSKLQSQQSSLSGLFGQ